MSVVAMFRWDCGRHGEVSSVFVCDRDVLEGSYGAYLNLGNALGVGVEISGVLEAENVTILSADANAAAKVHEIYGDTLRGRNPLRFLQNTDNCFSEAY